MKESCEFRAAYEGDTGEKVVCSPTTVVTEKRGKWATEGLTVLPRASLDAHGPRSPTQHHQRGQSPSYSHPKPWKQGIPTYSCLQPHTLGQGVLWTPPPSCTGPPAVGVGGTQRMRAPRVGLGGTRAAGGGGGGQRRQPGQAGNGRLRPPEAGGGRAGPGASPHWRRRLSGRQGRDRGRGRRNLPGLGAVAAGAGQDALPGAAAAALGLPPSPPPAPASCLPRQPGASSSSSSRSGRAGERQPCARRAPPRCRR